MIIFTIITAPFYLFKGPFTTLKKIAVSTIMQTRHTYLATFFLSTDEINNLMNKNNMNTSTSEVNLNDVQIKKNASNEIIRIDLHPASGRYDGYLLEIPTSFKVKVAMTKHLNTVGERTSELAIDHNALAAINGGAFTDNLSSNTFGGSGATPGGFVISNGEVIYPESTNETKNNEQQTVTAITKSGHLLVGKYSINDLKKLDVSEALCFSLDFTPPALIVGGKGQITSNSAGNFSFNPRTAIGQTSDGTILFLVMDGRANVIKSGATLKDVQDELLSRGAVTASNLDGGFSSSIYYNGEVINNPHGLGGERYVATAFYVAP